MPHQAASKENAQKASRNQIVAPKTIECTRSSHLKWGKTKNWSKNPKKFSKETLQIHYEKTRSLDIQSKSKRRMKKPQVIKEQCSFSMI